jgi:Mor family transcriptional regulator
MISATTAALESHSSHQPSPDDNGPTVERRRSELLEDVEDQVADALVLNGIDPDYAKLAATAAADRLADHWGGAVLSFPRELARKRAKRDEEILERFNGRNLAALAREYDMTEAGTRKALKRANNRYLQRVREVDHG